MLLPFFRTQRPQQSARTAQKWKPTLEWLEDRTAPAVVGGYTINEFALPTSYHGPNWLRAGPDGAVWFNQYPQSETLVRITVDGQFSGVQAPFPVWDFAFAPDGNIWLGGQTRIAEITQEGTLLHDYPIPSASPPGIPNTGLHVTVGPDSNVWYIEPYTSDVIGRLTPDGQITEYHSGQGDWGAAEIINGPDGNIWFEGTDARSIGRITPDGAMTIFNLPSAVRGLTAGPDGNLWMSSNDRIFRVNTAGQLTGNFATPTPNASAYQVTAGSDGALWFAEYGVNQIGRITTDGSITEIPITTGNYIGGAIITGPDGNIWVSELPSNSIGRIVLQPPTLRLSGRVFDDRNNDGLVNGSDTGLSGVTVKLYNENDLTNPLATQLTDANGFYTFTVTRLPGTYRIVETQPAGYLDGKEAAGNLGGSVDNSQDSNTISTIVITASSPDGDGYNFAEIRPSRIQGLVWEDFNDNAEVDFGEKAIEGVVITLTGTDDRGNAVQRPMPTDAQGIYEFLDLRPGTYTITETQPAGFTDGRDSPETPFNDQFRDVALAPGSDAVNYNFGERPPVGGTVSGGQTASIGFWQNKNGQNLIKALNGGPASTQLANWLAATFPNLYGADAGASNLTTKTNADVAAFFTSLFKRTAQTSPGGPPKVDAQVLATALAVYVTNENLAGTTAAAYGFQVTATGVGSATFNIGSNGAAFGVANNTNMLILDILLAINARTRHGLLGDQDGSGTIDSLERAYREIVNAVCSAINEQGNI